MLGGRRSHPPNDVSEIDKAVAGAEAPCTSDTPMLVRLARDSGVPAIAGTGTAAGWLVRLSEVVSSERRASVAVVLLGVLAFLPFLGTLTLWDPWETHYGEVAREMIARDDYVYPHWESAYFFSKPALPIWLMAAGMWVVGADAGPPGAPLGAWTEWGARMPFALIAIATLWAVYRIGRQMGGRNVGLLSAFVLVSSAQFIFIGKQAMADMPLVGFLTIGLAFFFEAVFAEEADRPATRQEKALAALAVAVPLGLQLFLIGRELRGLGGHLGLGAAGLVGAVFVAGILLRGTAHGTRLVGFYVCLALATLSKGLAPVAVLGVTGLVYVALTVDFRVFLRARVVRGVVLFLLVAAPWYLTLSLFDGRDGEGRTFVERFWIHDNLNRVGAGVHGDRGGFGYYLEQLAYGMFPWSAVIPSAIFFAARASERQRRMEHRRLVLFVMLWALATYAFFTMSQTKFHHYIFPAVPAFAVLVGAWFVHLAEDPVERLSGWVFVPAGILLAVISRDLISDPQHLVNLFTYKYDREYPRELNPRAYLIPIIAAGSLALVVTYALRQKGKTLLAFLGLATVFAAWVSHHHFNMLSPHWGQKHLFETFYEEREGDEPLYAYQLNWRGETFYSRNTVLQVKESGANTRIRSLVDRPGREFIITEQSRFHTLRNVLSFDKREKLRILDRSNNKFYLCVVEE